jgi:EAL domain-containing protein (putative c-di-GMP-specific phosphodiesterase class I)
MAVNLSSVQFRDPSLLDSIVGVLRDVGLESRCLELELTESTLLRKGDTTLATMKELKRMGLHLSIDDFGTGYSSLSYLRRLPIDGLKIDQSFIREVTTNPPDAAITTSIILMGKSLKLRVVAEGVESQSQLTFLSVLECDEAQGYFFSRPIPADDAQALLARGLAAR